MGEFIIIWSIMSNFYIYAPPIKSLRKCLMGKLKYIGPWEMTNRKWFRNCDVLFEDIIVALWLLLF